MSEPPHPIPPPRPAGPGAAAFGETTTTGRQPPRKLTLWMLILAIVLIVARLVYVVAVITLLVLSSAMTSASLENGDLSGIVIWNNLLGLVSSVLYVLNGLISLPLLLVSVIVAVKSWGRGRAAAIAVIVVMVLGVIAHWALLAVTGFSASDLDLGETVSTIAAVLEVVRSLVVWALLLAGSLMAHGWARRESRSFTAPV